MITLEPPAEIRLLSPTFRLGDMLEQLEGCTQVALDTETYPLNGLSAPRGMVAKDVAFTDPHSNRVRLIQLMGRKPDGQTTDIFVIDLLRISKEEKARLAAYLDSPFPLWVGQNLKFDWKMLNTSLGVRLKRVYCLMLASQILGHASGKTFGDQRGHSLKDLVRDFLGIWLDKTEQKSQWGSERLTESQIRYAAEDVRHILPLMDTFNRSFEKEWDILQSVWLEMQVLPVVARLETVGIGFDLKVYKLVHEAAKAALPQMRYDIGKAFGLKMQACMTPAGIKLQPNVDFNSPVQLVTLLNDAGIPAQNAQSSHLDELKHEYPRLKLIIEYLQVYKQVTFDYEAWVHPITRRLHPTFVQCGAATGRFSARWPNMQQVPRFDLRIPDKIAATLTEEERAEYAQYDAKTGVFEGYFVNYRRCFVAPEGRAFVTSDFSGQEIAVAVFLSRDENMASVLRQPPVVADPSGKLDADGRPVMIKNMGADIHAGTAEMLWRDQGITCWNAKKTPFPGVSGKTYRDIVKAIVFGLLYGKSAKSLGEELGISEQAAEDIIETFFRPYQSLKRWLKLAAKVARNSKSVRFGSNGLYRVRFVADSPKTDRGAMDRAGMNTPIQGLSALMTKLALVYLEERLDAENAKLGSEAYFLIGTVHDEINAEGPWELRHELEQILKEEMERAQDFFLDKFIPAKSEPGSGVYWQK